MQSFNSVWRSGICLRLCMHLSHYELVMACACVRVYGFLVIYIYLMCEYASGKICFFYMRIWIHNCIHQPVLTCIHVHIQVCRLPYCSRTAGFAVATFTKIHASEISVSLPLCLSLLLPGLLSPSPYVPVPLCSCEATCLSASFMPWLWLGLLLILEPCSK